jgi:DNA replication protein DnaC
MRYLVYTKCRKLTHFTSNIYPAEIENLYGTRAASRLAEMCNIIELTGIDFRKK